MDRQLVQGVEVDHAGRRWRVHRALGPDAILLTNETGEMVSTAPTSLTLPAETTFAAPARGPDERHYTDAQWAEAARRRDLMTALAQRPDRSRIQVDDVAKELGIKRRRVYALLGSLRTGGDDVAIFLPQHGKPRAKRLDPAVEAIIKQMTDEHYAQASRPSLMSLHKAVTERCAAAGISLPSLRAVQSRVQDRDQAWLTRRREGTKAARALRLLTGAHPGAVAPWERVQIDSTPCDILLVREEDRIVIGRPNFTIAIDLYSRVVPGFSVSLEAASTVTVLSQKCGVNMRHPSI